MFRRQQNQKMGPSKGSNHEVVKSELGDKTPGGVLDYEATHRVRVSRPESVAMSPQSVVSFDQKIK